MHGHRVLADATRLGLALVVACLPAAALPARARAAMPPANAPLSFTAGGDRLIMQICRSNVLRMTYEPHGLPAPHTLVVSDTPCAAVDAGITRAAGETLIRTAQMTVRIGANPLRVSLYDAAGHLLLTQPQAAGTGAYRVHFTHGAGDQFYGVSAVTGSPDITSNAGGEVHAGSEGTGGGPFIWSTSGYGFLADYGAGEFDAGDTSLDFLLKARFPDSSPFHQPFVPSGLTYYLLVGAPGAILHAEAQVSGQAPLFPKSSLGFANSQWGSDEAELKSIVATYRAKHEPIDSFIMDFDWKDWGADNYGEFRWNPVKYLDGASGSLKRYLDARGIKLLGIMKPRIRVDSAQGRWATAHGCWFPNDPAATDYQSGRLMRDLNFYLPTCRAWFWSHIQHAFDTGISGWWNDEQDFGGIDTPVFEGMNMERALYEGQRSHSNQRVWSLNRNFFLGAQRYAYGLWSGDIDTGFSSMAAQRASMLSAAALGETQWSMDIGGFHNDPTPENYARWMQFGAFVPIYRVHGEYLKKRQPWRFGPHAEAIATQALELRYSLIPYIYSYVRRTQDTGLGLVEPLTVYYPRVAQVRDYADAWMFGEYLLVAPVVEQGQTIKSIYLPAGTWLDYFKGTVYRGGRTIRYPINAESWADIPLFIKKGAIIATQPVMDYVDQRPVTTITLDAFPDRARTNFQYYDDDGISYDYERGDYYQQEITTQSLGGTVSLQIGTPRGTYRPALRQFLCRVHTDSAATGVTIDGQPLTRYPSLKSLTAASGEGWSVGRDSHGPVTYVKIRAGKGREVQLRIATS